MSAYHKAIKGTGIENVSFFELLKLLQYWLCFFTYATVLKHTDYMCVHENLILFQGSRKRSLGGLVSHSAGSEQKEIKRAVNL